MTKGSLTFIGESVILYIGNLQYHNDLRRFMMEESIRKLEILRDAIEVVRVGDPTNLNAEKVIEVYSKFVKALREDK